MAKRKKQNKPPLKQAAKSKNYYNIYTDGAYVGKKYTAGRKAGRKNLQKLDNGNVINEHGVEFTQAEKRKMENLVNRVNKKAIKTKEKLYQEAAKMVDLGRRSELNTMGSEPLFNISHRSKSMQRFKSKKQFDRYIKSLEKVMEGDYLDNRTRQYKMNYLTALENKAGGAYHADIAMKIRMMKPEEYRAMVLGNEELEIGYVYRASDLEARLNRIRSILGMKLQDY